MVALENGVRGIVAFTLIFVAFGDARKIGIHRCLDSGEAAWRFAPLVGAGARRGGWLSGILPPEKASHGWTAQPGTCISGKKLRGTGANSPRALPQPGMAACRILPDATLHPGEFADVSAL